LLSSEVWALGLGDIRLESALNEPLRAEIELLSATPDELDNLTVVLASGDTFERYGLDRPFYLSDIQFSIIRSGRADGNIVQLRSATPMAEPFLTFLVEASWTRGRLLREYTVLLDPPTFAPPVRDTAPAVQAPSRTAPADSGQIQRPTPAPRQQRPAPVPAQTTPPVRQPVPEQQPVPEPQPAPEQPKPQLVEDVTPYDTGAGGDYNVQRSETLWGIASRVKPDNRLTMNQTMLAIFEANPQAFGGNINILRAGASLRIPSADEIFQISRGDALAEAQRQHAEWSGGTVPPVADTRPSLILVPPDDDYTADTTAPLDTGYDVEPYGAEPTAREQEIEQRIAELEGADVPQQQSLIEIRDNELAALRNELAQIRGEVYEPPVDDVVTDDVDPFADPDADIIGDDTVDEADPAGIDADDATAEATPPPSTIIRTPTADDEPGLVDRVLGILTEWWMIIVGVVVIVGGALFWFMRRDSGDEDDPDSWQPLDDEMQADDALASTESLRAPVTEESFVVVEQESSLRPQTLDEMDETVDALAPEVEEVDATIETPAAPEPTDGTGTFDSLEDTFSSETAINLDQTDPIAEADFHMAYGLYDQAADLITGALEAEPDRQDFLTKLCEIYFVWGNRDAFIDSAGKLKAAVGDTDSEDWNKIVIMGQQIAADDGLFAGASAGATKAVDLSFEADMHETGALDMELIAETDGEEDIVDLGGADVAEDIVDLGGADSEETAAVPAADADTGVDFFIDSDDETEVVAEEETELAPVDIEPVDLDETAESPDFDVTREMPATDETAEMPTAEITVETPTIEQQFDVLGGTAELPSLDDTLGEAIEDSGQAADATAEINLDDLGLDVDSFAETELASLDDLDATGEAEALVDTGINEQVDDLADVTGKNLEIDPDETGLQAALSVDDTGINEALSETGLNEALDESLLDATGVTQVLSADLAVDTTTDAEADLGSDDATMLAAGYGDETADAALEDDQETMLASLDDDDDEGVGDFDFAKTEALPKEAFSGENALDETGEMPAVASTDVDLDLDDLTAALKVSEAAGDTIEQVRDDATVEQPRPTIEPEEDDSETLSIAPDDMSEDLHDARTMTEVGTKLDLARAYVDMGDPAGARSILEEVLDEGDEAQRQQAQQLLDSLPS